MRHFAIPSKATPYGPGATIEIYNAYCGRNGAIKMFCDHNCDACSWKNQSTLGVTTRQTPAPHPQQEYIITDRQLQKVQWVANSEVIDELVINIRSRPSPAPAPERQPCKYMAGEYCDTCYDATCDFYPFKQHDAATVRQARSESQQRIEQVIKELEISIKDSAKIGLATIDPEGKAFWRGKIKQAEEAIALLQQAGDNK